MNIRLDMTAPKSSNIYLIVLIYSFGPKNLYKAKKNNYVIFIVVSHSVKSLRLTHEFLPYLVIWQFHFLQANVL